MMYGPGQGGSSAMVDMVGSGDMDLTTALSRIPFSQKQTFVNELAAKYPQYSQAQYGVQKALQTSFTSGTYSQNLNAINTARQHMKTFEDTATALQNGDTQALNKLGNAWNEQFGSPAPTNFGIARDVFAAEVGKALAGAGVTEGDRQQVQESIKSSESPAQLLGAAKTADSLLSGKQQALKQTYEQGKKGQPNFGGPENAPGGAGGTQGFTLPAGAKTAVGPNGHRIAVVGGKWVDAQTGAPLQ